MSLTQRALFALVLTGALTAPAFAQTPATPGTQLTAEQTQRIDEYGTGALKTLHIAGMAVAVVRNGVVVYRKGFGLKNIATKAPVLPDTRFEIGSLTKQFTAAAVLQLAAQNKLNLEDPLGKYTLAYRPARNVTIRQLLNQVSGIPNYTDVKHFEVMAPKTTPSFERIISLISKKPLEFKPGTKWEYSNTNYILLGKVIEVASHQTYTRDLFAHVIKPAGMSGTVTMDDEKGLSNVATGYWPGKKGLLSPSPSFGAGWAWSAGYLVSDLDDMARWDAAFFGGKIVSLADVTLATTSGKLTSGKKTTYGFGWISDKQNGHRRVWHNGGTFGFASANLTYPDDGVDVIVLINSLAPSESVASRVFDILYPPAIKAAAGEDAKITARAKEWLHRFETGDVDRTQLTKKMSDALTPDVIQSAKSQFGDLGEPTTMTFTSKTAVGTSNVYVYRLDFPSISLNLEMSIDADGKINGFFFKPA